MKTCVTNVYNSPEFTPLRGHLSLNPLVDTTLQQMSDKTFATSTEIEAIFATHPHIQACRKAVLSGLAQSEPSLVPILIASYNKQEDDLLALTQKKITWGDYVQRRDRATETQAALLAEDRSVVSGLQQEHQAEIAQRQRAAEALSAWAQTQQLINAANRPVMTDCNAFGSTVNCVTH